MKTVNFKQLKRFYDPIPGDIVVPIPPQGKEEKEGEQDMADSVEVRSEESNTQENEEAPPAVNPEATEQVQVNVNSVSCVDQTAIREGTIE